MGGPGFVPTFLFYFVGTTFISAFVIAQGSTGLEGVNPFQVGILFGLLAGGVGSYYNTHQTVSFPIKNRGAFVKTLKDGLSQMGYKEQEQEEDLTIYARPMPSSFFSGKLFVQLEQEAAIVSGRSSMIRSLKKRVQA
jgi:hypothetical protein